MRILRVHNYYQQPGGEDVSFNSEVDLFLARGHEVRREEFRNDSIQDKRSLLASASLAATTVWSRSAQHRLQQAISDFQPDVAHFYNTFPLVSPASYYTCRQAGIPVVQTLANYRLLCPSATLYRDNHACEDCIGRKVAWPGIRHACYHDSRIHTATVAAMQTTHRLLRTWHREVDIYIALSDASREIFIRGGLPENSIVVKPNFLDPDPGVGMHHGNFALYVGRLSPEKGISTLLRAWEQVTTGIPLKIVGNGPLAYSVEQAIRHNPQIEWLGNQSADKVLDLMGEATFLVFPSEWNETFGRTIIEAYAKATPVLSSNTGAAKSIVVPGETGLHFEAANAADLAEKVNRLSSHQAELGMMGFQARRKYEREFTADQNYSQLLRIYNMAIARHGAA